MERAQPTLERPKRRSRFHLPLRREFALLVASVAFHAAGLSVASGARMSEREHFVPLVVALEVPQQEEAPSQEEPLETPPKVPEPNPRPPREPEAPPPPEANPPLAPPPTALPEPLEVAQEQTELPSEEPPALLTNGEDGLTNPNSWQSGTRYGGMLQPKRARARSEEPARPRPLPPSKPTELPLSKLSRKPVPPSMESRLKQHYPSRARLMSESGTAVIRARIDADGVVRQVSLVEASRSDFGAGCLQALRGSRWEPPLGPSREPTATWVRYTCRFVANSGR